MYFVHLNYQMIQEWYIYILLFLNTLHLIKHVYFHDVAVFYLTLVNKLLDLNMIINVMLLHFILIVLHQPIIFTKLYSFKLLFEYLDLPYMRLLTIPPITSYNNEVIGGLAIYHAGEQLLNCLFN